MPIDKGDKLWILAVVAYVLIWAALVVGIFLVIMHFISKYW